MIILEVNSCLLATETGLIEFHDAVLRQVHLDGHKIKAIAMLADKNLLIAIKDS